MSRQGGHAHAVHPVQRCTQGDASTDVGGASFKFVGKLVVRRSLLEADRTNHLPASAIRRHGVEQGLLSVQDPDARGPVRFVPTEHVKIHVQIANINLQVRDGLCPVHEHHGAGVMCPGGPMLHVVHCPQSVGDVGERHELGLSSKMRFEHLGIQRSIFVQFHDVDVKTLLQRQHLPRHNVAVVLHASEHHAIAGR